MTTKQLSPQALKTFSSVVAILADYTAEDRAEILRRAQEVLLTPTPVSSTRSVDNMVPMASREVQLPRYKLTLTPFETLHWEGNYTAAVKAYRLGTQNQGSMCSLKEAVDAVREGLMPANLTETTDLGNLQDVVANINLEWRKAIKTLGAISRCEDAPAPPQFFASITPIN